MYSNGNHTRSPIFSWRIESVALTIRPRKPCTTQTQKVKYILIIFLLYSADLPFPPFTRMKETKISTLERSSKVENFSCEEWRSKENCLTPVKLESKKQTKKVIARRKGFGLEVSIDRFGSSHVPILLVLSPCYI